MKYKPAYYNPWGEDGKQPSIFAMTENGKQYIWVEDTFDGNKLIMAHWEPEENVSTSKE